MLYHPRPADAIEGAVLGHIAFESDLLGSNIYTGTGFLVRTPTPGRSKGIVSTLVPGPLGTAEPLVAR